MHAEDSKRNYPWGSPKLEFIPITEIKLSVFTGSERKQGNSRKISTCFIDYTKAFDCVDCNRPWRKLLKRWEYQTILPVSWETYLWVKKQWSEHYMEQLTGSGLRKEYDKAVYCHPVMQSTSCEMPGWMSYKLESRLLGEISTVSDMQMIPI